MPTAKQGIVLIQSFGETRTLVKKLAHSQGMTIPQYLAQLVEAAATEASVALPESYKAEGAVDRKLAKGDFKDRGAGKPKIKEEFFLPDTRKEWEKLFAHRWEEFGAWYKKARSTPGHEVEWPGEETYYNNLHIG